MPERGSNMSTVLFVSASFGFVIQMSSCRTRLLTMDETWLYDYDQEAKQQSMEWRHSGSLCAKKFREQESSEKFLASIFWDQDSFLRIDFLQRAH
jgi:hypothetical protein